MPSIGRRRSSYLMTFALSATLEKQKWVSLWFKIDNFFSTLLMTERFSENTLCRREMERHRNREIVEKEDRVRQRQRETH